MKKIICGALVSLMAISLMACSGDKKSEKETKDKGLQTKSVQDSGEKKSEEETKEDDAMFFSNDLELSDLMRIII